MQPVSSIVVGSFLALAMTATPLGAAEPGRVWLVAVGVEQYRDAAISALRYAAADARAVAAAFAAGGVDRAGIELLTSDAASLDALPTRSNVFAALERTRARARAGDTVVFFFAGHGVERGDRQYLLTVDTRYTAVERFALSLDDAHEALRGVQASQVLFLLDACRNDPEAGRGDAGAALSEGLARSLRPRPLGLAEARTQAALLLACGVGQRAWEMESEGHGAFTWFLLEAMAQQTAAGQPVELQGLYQHLRRELPLWCERARRAPQEPFLDPPDATLVLLPAPRLAPLPPTPAAVAPPAAPPAEPVAVPAVAAPDDLGTPPAGWPRYLATFQPPPGRTWDDYRVAGPDRMPQARVPAATYRQGAGTTDRLAAPSERPQRQVDVAEFWIDLHEVTNGQYRVYLRANRDEPDPDWRRWADATSPQHPAVFLDWEQARRYAAWAGRALPTEAQWEWAARAGVDNGRAFPWGDQPDPAAGNLAGPDQPSFSFAAAVTTTRPVTATPPNGLGVFDLLGNVWEWCQDHWTEPLATGEAPPEPTGYRAVRGGSWFSPSLTRLRVSTRQDRLALVRQADLGFRCVGAR